MTEITYLKETSATITALREVYYIRWMRKAQKMALLEWRDRKQTPGVAARFEESAYKDYDFAERNPFYWRKKGNDFRPYHYSGAFASQLATRQPKGIRSSGTEVRTRFAYGGGVLNLLNNKFGVLDWYREKRRVNVFVKPYDYRNKHGSVHVRGYNAVRTHTKYVFIKSARSYAADWGHRFTTVDAPWLQRRTTELFIQIYRKATITKGGKQRARFFGDDE